MDDFLKLSFSIKNVSGIIFFFFFLFVVNFVIHWNETANELLLLFSKGSFYGILFLYVDAKLYLTSLMVLKIVLSGQRYNLDTK